MKVLKCPYWILEVTVYFFHNFFRIYGQYILSFLLIVAARARCDLLKVTFSYNIVIFL